MTRKERLRAYSLRLDGYSWRDIARRMDYDESTLRADALYVVRQGPRCPKTRYAALRRYLMRECCGSVSEFARRCGVSRTTMVRILRAEQLPSAYTLEQILDATGLTYDEAFAEEGDGDGW